jgi:hypothetical protein
MSKINTNMASEFWFFGQLHRLGYKAYITLGNTKSVDITIQLSDQTLLTFDVKGKQSFKQGTYQYLPTPKNKDTHYYAFIGLESYSDKQTHRTTFTSEPVCFLISDKYLKNFADYWKPKSNVGGGYGFDQKILRLIYGYTGKNHKYTKNEQKTIDKFLTLKKIKVEKFKQLKKHIFLIADFEDKYYAEK